MGRGPRQARARRAGAGLHDRPRRRRRRSPSTSTAIVADLAARAPPARPSWMEAGAERPAPPTRAQCGELRRAPLLRPGNSNCGGCGMSTALQLFGRAVGRRAPVQLVIPASCAAVMAGPFPYHLARRARRCSPPSRRPPRWRPASPAWRASTARAPASSAGRATAAPTTSGWRASPPRPSATRTSSTSATTTRFYGNTGGQRSSATPAGASTTNTPGGKVEEKKDILAIMAAHRVPTPPASRSPTPTTRSARCAARSTARVPLPARALARARPAGSRSRRWGSSWSAWRCARASSPWSRSFDGRKLLINLEPDFSEEALELYLSLQRRFQRSGITAERLRPAIAQAWRDLRARSGRIVPADREG